MGHKPFKLTAGGESGWGIGLHDPRSGEMQASHYFSGKSYATEENAQKAIERFDRKFGRRP